MTVLAAQLVSTGLANFLCCLVLAVFGVVAWISIRHNIRGIDFERFLAARPSRRVTEKTRIAASEPQSTGLHPDQADQWSRMGLSS
ncbi:hypothetical protein JCM18920_18 [Cutibacterium acnes JCM 18920]|nr:hypothetical protein JCM18920_18 [Cutibacterium acnes JCM 18920]